jgi:hypothetical protein
MAKAICGEHACPALYEQTVIIVECEIVLLNIRAARVAAIKRHSIVGQKLERPNQLPGFSANEFTFAFEALLGGELRPVIRLIKRQTRTLRAVRMANADAKVGAKQSDRADRKESSPPSATCSHVSTQRSDEGQRATQVRDELDAFQHALPELVSLERYERRAVSRRKQAIRMFEAISILSSFSPANRGASQNTKMPLHRTGSQGESAPPEQ